MLLLDHHHSHPGFIARIQHNGDSVVALLKHFFLSLSFWQQAVVKSVPCRDKFYKNVTYIFSICDTFGACPKAALKGKQPLVGSETETERE